MPWDKTLIAEGVLAPDLNDEIRANWAAIEAALDAWIYFATGGTQTGQPRQGSARVYFQDAVPTTRLDGNHFGSTDLGCIWIDSNSTPDNQFNILTAADGAGAETWTPISTEIIAVLVAQINTWALAQTFSVNPVFTEGIIGNNAYLQARNAADDGNVNLIKADASGVAVVPDKTENATNAAPTSQKDLANKKYVDDQDVANADPTYTGGSKTHTSVGGLIKKWGTANISSGTSVAVSFGTAFPGGIENVQFTGTQTASTQLNISVSNLSVSGFTINHHGGAAMNPIYWKAIGY